MALFSNLAGDSSSSKNLVEFKAGKMHMKGTTVTPDKRKGFVYVHQSDDSLMHFCWKDRTSGVVEDDLIIFPDDIEFKRVPQCTTGRVYLLKFKSSSRKFFFWMQEPKAAKDDEICKKVNENLNNPPTPGSGDSGGLANLPPGLASIGDQLGDANLQRLLGSVDQNQLLQLLGVSGLGGRGDDSRASSRPVTSQSTTSNTGSLRPATQASTTTQASATPTPKPPSAPEPAATTTTAAKTETTSSATKPDSKPDSKTDSKTDSKPVVQLSDLQSILANMQVPAGGQEQQSIDLSTAFNTDALAPLLSDPEVQQRLSLFLPLVKGLSQSEDDVKETIQSPQFKQALSVFSAALQSGQLAPLMQQFGLGDDAIEAASRGDILSFVKALQKAEGGSKDTQDPKDEEMPLD